MKVDKVSVGEFARLIFVWEASVRATHHFLKEEDIQYFKPLILDEYLPQLEVRCIRNDQREPIGFIGVNEAKIEMLFVHPEAFGKGIGKLLLKYAVEHMHAVWVDVNEDNQQAVGFYEHVGFKIVSRSEVDSLGKPFPVLHMGL